MWVSVASHHYFPDFLSNDRDYSQSVRVQSGLLARFVAEEDQQDRMKECRQFDQSTRARFLDRRTFRPLVVFFHRRIADSASEYSAGGSMLRYADRQQRSTPNASDHRSISNLSVASIRKY